jgi:uncharacterized protein YaeQ
MTNKDSTAPFVNLGAEQAKAAAALQKELLDTYEQANRAWFTRVQSEAALWTELAAKLMATRSASEAVEAYTKCVSQQVQMTVEDGQRLVSDCQQITQKITKSLSNGWPAGGGT